MAYPGANGRPWKPRNYGNERFGEQSLHQALAHSNNVVTVKLLDQIGIPRLVEFGARLGLNLPAQNGLSLALGTADVSLDDLVQAYTPLAAGGTLAQERTILKIHERRTGAWAGPCTEAGRARRAWTWAWVRMLSSATRLSTTSRRAATSAGLPMGL